MKKSMQTFGLSIFIVLAFVTIGIGFLFGIDNPVPWIMIVILLSLPYIHKKMLARKFINWDDKYSVGIKAIDDDHKQLISYINMLQTSILYPTGEAYEREALNNVINYTKYHFEREEEMMRKYEYPDFDAHKKIHEEMIAKVEKYMASYEQDREGTITDLSQFLKNWLIRHIAGTDQEYSEHLISRGAS